MTPLAQYVFRRVSQLRSADWLMMLCVFVLIVFGLAAIYSVDLSREGTLLSVKKQLVALFIGLLIGFLFASSHYKLLRNYSFILFCAGLLSLIGVLLFGTDVRGARGWFVFSNVSIQPVEFMKFALIVVLATYFSERARTRFGWKELGESFFLTMIPVVLTLMQPDFGSAFVLIGIWFCVALFAGMGWRFVALLAFLGTGLFAFAWRVLFAEYQKLRILTFLSPESDPLGQGYNVSQAIIAIGAGGWIGRGLGFGSQSQLKFLPESHTDFVFAVIAEELGFVGVVLIFIAFSLLCLRIGKKIQQAQDSFTALLLVGVGSVLFLQFFVNVGMNLGLFPVTGIGLPFVSYGGSSLVLFLILFGMVQSIAIHARRVLA